MELIPDLRLAPFAIDHRSGQWSHSRDFARLIGLAADEELTAERFLESLAPGDRETIRAALRKLDQKENEGSFEGMFRIAAADSSLVSVRCNWFTRHDADGHCRETIGTLLDLSGSQAIDSALYEREYRLRSILDTAVDAIITIDKKGTITGVNQATQQLFGFTADELIGKNVSILMPAPYRDEHDGYLARYERTREPRIIGIGREVVACRKDGTTFPADLAVSEIDHLGMFTGIVRDITQRKEAEISLQAEREFTQKILDTARALIVVGDRQGNILRANSYFEAISGFKQAELIGRGCLDVLAPDRQQGDAKRQLEAALAGMCEQGAVHAMPTRSGLIREIAWWHTPLTNEDGEIVGLVCAGRDVTEFKQLQKKIVQSERLAALGEAMAGLAHESRNALQRSQVCLDLLSARAADDHEAQELLDSIQLSMDDLNRLYEEVRAYAAPIQVTPDRVLVGQVIREAWESLTALRKDRHIHFEEHISCDLHCEIDAFAMGRVFHNIFENSLQACDGDAEIHVTYSEAIRDGHEMLKIAIRDNGPGIAAENQNAVFDSFFTTKSQGTGLGMAIALRVVEAHRGEIEINCDCTDGAEFIITLPRH